MHGISPTAIPSQSALDSFTASSGLAPPPTKAVKLNADHSRWMGATAVVAAAASAGYVAYAKASPYGPFGGSWPGLFFGIAGTLMMAAAGLLAARKKVRTMRLGSAQGWMRMHLWLGLLAVPFIWFHSGFQLGGPLTTALMILFYVVIASGLVGVILQQSLPAAMTAQVTAEIPIAQIDHVADSLASEAYELVASVTGTLSEAVEERKFLADEEALLQARPGYWKQNARLRPAETPEPEARVLADFYRAEVRPYLRRPARNRQLPPSFKTMLVQARPEWRAKLERLAAICDESRQLAVQRRLHALLHNWLFVHAPLSFTLFVLAAFHIALALRY